MNDFHANNAWQRNIRDNILKPYFYDVHAVGGRYVFLDKGALSTQLQREYAVDTVVQGRSGAAVFVEEKIISKRERPLTAFFLETDSCTVPGHQKEGWMHYGKADKLLWCFEQKDGSLDCYMLDFQKLKTWFWTCYEKYPAFTMREQNKTRGRLVPIVDVLAVLPGTLRFTVREPKPEDVTTWP